MAAVGASIDSVSLAHGLELVWFNPWASNCISLYNDLKSLFYLGLQDLFKILSFIIVSHLSAHGFCRQCRVCTWPTI